MGHLRQHHQIRTARQVLLAGNAAPSRSFSQQMTTSAPIAWWRLGETSGTSAADASGNSRTGTYTAPTFGGTASGAVRNDADPSVKLNGTSAKIQSASYILNATMASAFCWIRPSAIGTARRMVIGCDDNSTGTFDKVLRLETAGTLSANAFDGGAKNVTGTTVLEVGKWYHVGVVADATNLMIYLNGAVEASVACGATYNGYTQANLAVGKGDSLNGTFFSGWIDEPAWWARALSAGEIAAMYAAGVKAMVEVSSIVYGASAAIWSFGAAITGADGVSPAFSTLEINAGGGGYISPLTATVATPSVSATYAANPVIGNAWRMLTDPVAAQFAVAADKYIRVPASGVLA